MVKKIRKRFKDKPFGRIKTVCIAKSYQMARREYVIPEKAILSKLCEDLSILAKPIEEIASNYGIEAKESIIRSGQEVKGENIESKTYCYLFIKKAAKLTEFVNELDSKIHFRASDLSNEIARCNISYSDKIKSPSTFAFAVYHITSDKHYIYDSKTKNISHRNGNLFGAHFREERGHILSFELESRNLLDHLIEEILHAKVPRYLQIKHDNIVRMRINFTNKLLKLGVDHLLETPDIKVEKESIIEDFKKFDNDLKQWFSLSKVRYT